jgi:hypothetical protein
MADLSELGAYLRGLEDMLEAQLAQEVREAVQAGHAAARNDHRWQSRHGEDGTLGTIGHEVDGLSGEWWAGENAVRLNDGTSPHDIYPSNAQALRFEVGGDVVFAAVVHHPGTAPDPFLDKAYERTRETLERGVENAIRYVFG